MLCPEIKQLVKAPLQTAVSFNWIVPEFGIPLQTVATEYCSLIFGRSVSKVPAPIGSVWSCCQYWNFLTPVVLNRKPLDKELSLPAPPALVSI